MKIIDQSHEIIWHNDPRDIVKAIEVAGRVCYKSEGNIHMESSVPFVERLIKSGHESVLEHQSITVRFITDRGVSHELVRHRIASFSQESTRYCNYSKNKFGGEITVIRPIFLHENSKEEVELTKMSLWEQAMIDAEYAYINMLDLGCTPQEARSVLPNSLKTEIVVTANIREWRTILKQRTSTKAHPQMRALMIPLLEDFKKVLPVLFSDIETY